MPVICPYCEKEINVPEIVGVSVSQELPPMPKTLVDTLVGIDPQLAHLVTETYRAGQLSLSRDNHWVKIG